LNKLLMRFRSFAADLQKPPLILQLAIALTAGIWSCGSAGVSADFLPQLSLLLLFLCALTAPRRARCAQCLLLAALFAAGGALWGLQPVQTGPSPASLLLLEQGQPLDCRVDGVVSGLVSLRGDPESPDLRDRGVRFRVRTDQVRVGNRTAVVSGLVEVYVRGLLPQSVNWGDRVSVLGRLRLPETPSNPGEFDFAAWAAREGITATLHVRHPTAVRLSQAASVWSPAALISRLRLSGEQQILRRIPVDLQGVATALLLGNRGLLSEQTERAFERSGTIHLLAVSGLHVGILYVFLMRVLHALLMPRNRALILSAAGCVCFALLTDMRPSVVRAACFLLIGTAAQLSGRQIRPPVLLSVTILLMVAFDPHTVFQPGAWLSFLAVTGLFWFASQSSEREFEILPDGLLLRDRIRARVVEAGVLLRCNFGRLLAVTMFVAPLVAAQFHLFSLVSLIVNLVLIPLTAVVLTLGFLFLGSAVLLPVCGGITAFPFSCVLKLLLISVSYSAEFSFGYLMIPDLPAWFLPVWYILLGGLLLCRSGFARTCLQLVLLILSGTQLWALSIAQQTSGLTCTVLNIGHGNAIVVEVADRVLLFDAGAMNQGTAAAGCISEFLWYRGHRTINAAVISHADADHYNALPELLLKMPTGMIITTRQCADSSAPDVQNLMQLCKARQIPVVLAGCGDQLTVDDLRVDFLQRRMSTEMGGTDNENSLAAVLEFHGQRVCVPADLELEGLDEVLPMLPECSVLISPHHGSKYSNPPQLFSRVRPHHVIVSSGNSSGRSHLQQVFPGRPLYFTSECGAVQIRITSTGQLRLSTFRSQPGDF